MSKAIAQTIGNKRFFWLTAMLVTFALLAGARFVNVDTAKADVNPVLICVDETTGPPPGVPAVPECANDADFAAPINVGDQHWWKVSVMPLAAPTLGDLQIVVYVQDEIIQVIQSSIGGSNAACTTVNATPAQVVAGTRFQALVCTWQGPIPSGSQGTVVFRTDATIMFPEDNVWCGVADPDGGSAAFLGAITAHDLASSQGVVAATDLTGPCGQFNHPRLTTFKSHSPAAPAPGGNVTYSIVVANGNQVGSVAATGLRIFDTIDATRYQSIEAVTSDGGGTCTGVGPFPDTTSPWPVDCSGYAPLAPGSQVTVTITAKLKSAADLGIAAGGTVNVVNASQFTATNFPLHPILNPVTYTYAFDSFNVSQGVTLPVLNNGLYHVNANGDGLLTQRDVDNNLIGWQHTVCLVDKVPGQAAGTFVDGALGARIKAVGGIQPPNANGVPRWRIDTQPPGNPTINGQNKINLSFAQYANGLSLPCVSWYSTAPGEQNVSIVDAQGQLAADWADGGTPDVCPGYSGATDVCGAPISDFTPLVKEWNVLRDTVITLRGANPLNPDGTSNQTVNLDGKEITRSTIFNAATSRYEFPGVVALSEHVVGTHTTGTATFVGHMIGAQVTVFVNGTCGQVTIDPGATRTVIPGVGNGPGPDTYVFNQNIDSVPDGTYVTNGGPLWFDVDTNNCTSLTGSYTDVIFVTTYPNLIGSFPPAPITERVRVRWAASVPAKQVFLAWAGQRVILEHDWRVGPGDNPADGSALGFCPFNEDNRGELGPVVFQYIKGTGPGNFVAGLGAVISSPDLAYVVAGGENQIDDLPDFPQDACISRVLYESEDPGEVDIELFAVDNPITILDSDIPVDDNQTKVAFVVYYMKIEDVKLGLVTSVSKPTHNSSIAGWSDYAPGNPWDASKDVATAEWNVSKDILVRGRVRGWFNNSNPSGRAQDSSDPLNVKPANRWVMPDDWALLAGGPADPADGSDAVGTAEQFRPYYDLLFAPNNKAGLFLVTPLGDLQQVATVVTAPGFVNGTAQFAVNSVSNLAVGSVVFIGSSQRTITNITALLDGNGNTVGVAITLNAALSGVPANGTPIFLVTVPFEGPYSLIDIPGLAGAGKGGAAASNVPGGLSPIRDTILADGDVDMWDAPMPPAAISVKIRGTGFIKAVYKEDVYYVGTPNSAAQVYTNPFYYSNIPDSSLIPASVAGGGYFWDSWGPDGPAAAGGLYASSGDGQLGQGPYHFWQPVFVGTNSAGIGESLTNSARGELVAIRAAYGDPSIARDLTLYSDNHGEFMVTANGDFNTDLTACATNALGGGKHCKPGDKVGKGTITATADYPDFRGKHFPVASNNVTVDWTWAGYKDVTIEDGETPQFKYIVFHALDRDGFCYPLSNDVGQVSLHPVLYGLKTATGVDVDAFTFSDATVTFINPRETVDFLIDGGEGIIIDQSGGKLNVDGTRQFATGVPTFSTLLNTVIKEFKFSPLATSGATDECQAWIKVSNSLLGVINFLVMAYDDTFATGTPAGHEGRIGFDRIVDLQTTATFTLNFRWTLHTWAGADNIPVADALKGTGANDAGNDIFDQVTAIYGWAAAAQDWLAYFPAGVSVPGANDLVALKTGEAYWIAIKGPGSVTWTYATHVGR